MTDTVSPADELRGWLAFAGENLDGVPDPSIVDAIEAEARADALDGLEAAMVAVLGDKEVSTIDGSMSVRRAAGAVRVILAANGR